LIPFELYCVGNIDIVSSRWETVGLFFGSHCKRSIFLDCTSRHHGTAFKKDRASLKWGTIIGEYNFSLDLHVFATPDSNKKYNSQKKVSPVFDRRHILNFLKLWIDNEGFTKVHFSLTTAQRAQRSYCSLCPSSLREKQYRLEGNGPSGANVS